MHWVSSVIARIRSYARGLRRPATVEAELAEEFRLHVELRTRDLVASGLTPPEARRQARVEFGHMETHREHALASRGLGVLDALRISRLDVKLGLRMLTKYPGLSLVSVIGMTVAVAVAAGAFAAVEAMVSSSLPLEDGDRIVAVQNVSIEDGGTASPQSVHDFVQWRRDLTSLQDLTAFSDETRNLVMAEGVTDVINVARMTASGFRVARVAPLLGRPLLDDDDRIGAQPVIVIGYDEWQRRFKGDGNIIGRQLRLGTELHTVVGVMPEGFRFPVNHQFWTPLQLEPARHERGQGPAFTMFGRLAPGTSMEEAQSELTTIGRQASAAWPETHAHLRPQVLPYTYQYSGLSNPASLMRLQAIKLAIGLLLVVVAVNVSVLVYARTATRTGEIAIRTALGASRRRVVTQLFVEAVVLSGTAAALGLGIAWLALGRLSDMMQGPATPFWEQYGLSLSLVLYVIGLALVASVIVGVLPALKVTGRRVQEGLKQITARGSQVQLGRMWTAMIVLQVAVAVAVLPYAIYMAAATLQRGTAQEPYPADEIVRTFVSIETSGETAPIETGGGTGPDDAAAAAEYDRFLAGAREFMNRLEAEPDVAGVAITRSFPGYEWQADLEVEGGSTLEIQYNDFGVGLLPLFTEMMAGREFTPADVGENSTAVIINENLARAVAGRPEAALGSRVRFAAQQAEDGTEPAPNAWMEVIGVVPDFTTTEGIDPDPDPLLYRPIALESAIAVGDNLQVAMRLRGAAGLQLAGRLRQIAATVDPGLQIKGTQTAASMRRDARQAQRYLGIGISIVTLSVLLLSAAGIYAMMSFTVARRRREIGIRAALGAGARQVLTGIFTRAGTQLGVGVIGGLVVALALDRAAGGVISRQLPMLLPIVAIVMLAVGLLAALGPARRGLSVQPTEALRGD
jgi:putative ABC transport system permease protein